MRIAEKLGQASALDALQMRELREQLGRLVTLGLLFSDDCFRTGSPGIADSAPSGTHSQASHGDNRRIDIVHSEHGLVRLTGLSTVESGYSHSSSDGRITTLGVPTRDRPEALHRSVLSYARCAARYDRKMRFLIADQSSDPGTRQTNLSNLEKIKLECNAEIRYAGVAEQEDFAQKLALAADVSPSMVAFAVLNPYRFRWRSVQIEICFFWLQLEKWQFKSMTILAVNWLSYRLLLTNWC